MTDKDDAMESLTQARAVLKWVHEQLMTANPPREQLGEYIGPSRILGLPRRGRFVRLGEVWRLGVFLVGTDGALFSAGDTVRAEVVGLTSHNSAYKAERREYADAAFRARYQPGTVVNFGASRIGLNVESLATSTGPLFARGRNVFVRWRRGVADDLAVMFNDYMVERMGLLLNPPKGSTD